MIGFIRAREKREGIRIEEEEEEEEKLSLRICETLTLSLPSTQVIHRSQVTRGQTKTLTRLIGAIMHMRKINNNNNRPNIRELCSKSTV